MAYAYCRVLFIIFPSKTSGAYARDSTIGRKTLPRRGDVFLPNVLICRIPLPRRLSYHTPPLLLSAVYSSPGPRGRDFEEAREEALHTQGLYYGVISYVPSSSSVCLAVVRHRYTRHLANRRSALRQNTPKGLIFVFSCDFRVITVQNKPLHLHYFSVVACATILVTNFNKKVCPPTRCRTACTACTRGK